MGRLVSACSRLSGWTRTVDKDTCNCCGLERYSTYRLLRMPVERSSPPRRYW
ncbi:DUF6255 family natural product biosynthesis protein [Streptomyces netropsis]|uniref:DUF6255 family natural product biosynthesis protein n=1 Tax=Streptomyces netropsis TaxID=55404 RepID=UPI0035717448